MFPTSAANRIHLVFVSCLLACGMRQDDSMQAVLEPCSSIWERPPVCCSGGLSRNIKFDGCILSS